jgi:hypothetical protein
MNVGHHISSCIDERIIIILNDVREQVRMIIRPISLNNLQENTMIPHWSSYSFNANNLYLYFYNMPIAYLKLLADRNGIALNQTASNLSLPLSNKMINDILLEERMEHFAINFPSQTTENLSFTRRSDGETLNSPPENVRRFSNIYYNAQSLSINDDRTPLQQMENNPSDEEYYEDRDDETETRFPTLSRFRYQPPEKTTYVSPILLIDVLYYPLQNDEGTATPVGIPEQSGVSPEHSEIEKMKHMQDCPICLENKCLDNFITTNCNHNFCEECVESLLKSKTLKLIRHPYRGILVAKIKCPMCRTRVNTFIVRKEHMLTKLRSLKGNAKNG